MQSLARQAEAPRGRQRRSAQAVGRILAAAEKVFAESGYEGATMAALAAAAGLPAANLHYHFGTKERLYQAVLENILGLWLQATDSIHDDADPKTALTAYIRAKLAYSRNRPFASRVFANEVLHGAAQLRSFLGEELRRKVAQKAAILEGWMRTGRMEIIEPRHLFFMIWAMTQTYADFSPQICAVLAKPALEDEDFLEAEQLALRLVLRGCFPPPLQEPSP